MCNKKKILFITNQINPYQNDFFLQIKKNKIFTKLVFTEKEIKNSPWKYRSKSEHANAWRIHPLKKFSFYKNLFRNFNPDVVLIGGYKIKDLFYILTIIKNKKIKKYFYLETPKNNMYVGFFLKKVFLRVIFYFFNFNGIFAVGLVAKKFYKNITKKVYNLPYSIDQKRYKKINHNIKYKNKIKFIFIGQLIKRKGISLILKAFSILKKENIILTIVGDGKEKKKLKPFLDTNNNFKYLGFVAPKVLPEILKKHDVLILPSLYEGWGVVVNEAMACGLSLILNCNVNSGKDYLKHNYNGLFFDNTAVSLTKQMMFCINNKKKIILFGKRNYKIFLKSKMNSKNAVKFFLSKIFY